MSYAVSYSGYETREAADEAAIADVRAYLGPKSWEAMLYDLGQVNGKGTAEAWAALAHTLAFVGVRGYPVYALGRRYALAAYRAWMHDGDDAVMTDDAGFPLNEGTVE